jgi:hypothetical protein
VQEVTNAVRFQQMLKMPEPMIPGLNATVKNARAVALESLFSIHHIKKFHKK